MAELGDLLGEWHKAKPSEKILIVGISVAAVGIAIYIHSKSGGATAPQTGSNSGLGGSAGMPGTSTTGGTPSNGQPVPAGTPTTPTTPTGTGGPVLASHPISGGSPVHTPTGTRPVTPKRLTPVMFAHPIHGGSVVTRVAARAHPIAGGAPAYHPIYPSKQLVISHIQSMPTAPNHFAPHVQQPPAPIYPTKKQVINHLQHQRRMPA